MAKGDLKAKAKAYPKGASSKGSKGKSKGEKGKGGKGKVDPKGKGDENGKAPKAQGLKDVKGKVDPKGRPEAKAKDAQIKPDLKEPPEPELVEREPERDTKEARAASEPPRPRFGLSHLGIFPRRPRSKVKLQGREPAKSIWTPRQRHLGTHQDSSQVHSVVFGRTRPGSLAPEPDSARSSRSSTSASSLRAESVGQLLFGLPPEVARRWSGAGKPSRP